MSREVDSRVVEMRFDNTNFEKNTKKTIASVDRLMEKLQFKGAEKGFEKLDEAAKDVDFGPMDESLSVLERHFGALEIVATTALVNITNKFVNAGEKLVKSLSVDQVMSGWNKYTDKTSNVQTIMNATGKSIDQVNGYLNKLMWYSDETSYSFSEMTSALSQMTAAGGNIEKMIPMIMGIANATADAGKMGFAFQSTIRNLTQSYSAGHLQLQDWKSLNLMGTATKALKQELIDTAVELGVIKKGEVTIASFESSLQKKWANTEVMEKTFAKYASMMEAAYELTQKNKGMTSSEALEQLKGQYGELAERAALAAQQATSFAQAIDSTKDAVSSKWMAVFETIFGNKEEATDTWTELANRLYDIFVPSIDALNERLTEGLDSGWHQLLSNEMGDQGDAYTYALEQVALATGALTEQQIEDAGGFSAALRENGVSADVLRQALDESRTSTEKLLALSDKELDAQGYDKDAIQKAHDQFLELNEAVQNGTLDLEAYAEAIGQVSGREHLMQGLWNIMDAIGKVVGPIKEAFHEIFPPADGERIYTVAERFDLLTEKLIITDETAEKIKKTFKGVFSVLRVGTTALSAIGRAAAKGFGLVVDAAGPVADVLLRIGAGLGDFVTEIGKVVTEGGTLEKKLGRVKDALAKLLSPLGDLGNALRQTTIGKDIDEVLTKGEEATGVLGVLYRTAKRVLTGLYDLLTNAAGSGTTLLKSAGYAIGTLITKLGKLGGEIADFTGATLPTMKQLEQNLSDMPKNLGAALKEFAEGFDASMRAIDRRTTDTLAPVKQFFTAVKEGFDAISGTDVYRLMSLADVGLLALAINQMGKAIVSLKKMLETPIGKLFDAMAGSFKQLTSAIKTWQKNNASKTLVSMASAMLILAGAMYVMSWIEPDRLGDIFLITATSIGILAGAAKLLEPTAKTMGKAFDGLKSSVLNAATLWGTAAALVALGVAASSIAKGFAALMEVLQKGNIAANAAALSIASVSLIGLMLALGKLSQALVVGEKTINHKAILTTGLEMLALGGAIKILSTALEPLSKIKSTSLLKAGGAVAALGVLMTAMMGTLLIVQKATKLAGAQNGFGMVAIAGGLLIAAQAVEKLAGIKLVPLEFAMTSMKTLMLLMTAMSALSARTRFGSGAAMLAMAGSLYVLAGAVQLFAVMGDAAIDGLIKVIGALTAITVASAWAGADGAVAIMTISSAMLVLAGAVAVYAKLGDDAWLALLKVAAALGGMTIAVVGLGMVKGDALNAAWVISTLSTGMIKLAAACVIFGYADWESLKTAGIVIGGLTVAFVAVGAIVSKFPLISVGLETLAKAFDKFGAGALKLAGAVAVIGVLSMFAGPICQAIVGAAPDIEEALVSIINLLCNVIVRCAEPLQKALFTVATVLIQTAIDLIGWAWNGGDTGNGGIQAALLELKDNVWNGIKDIFSPFEGNGQFQQRNIAFKFNPDFEPKRVKVTDIFTFSGARKAAEEEGKDLGKNVSDGSEKGIKENTDKPVAATDRMMHAVIEQGYTTVDAHSPSRVFEQLGQYITEGLAIGIGDQSALARARAAMLNVATSIREVFTTYWGIHSPSDLAMSDAENILEGAVWGMCDEDAREKLRQESYNAASAVKEGAGTALDEAAALIQEKMLGIYDSFKMNPLANADSLRAGVKDAQKNFEKTVQDSKLIPGKNGIQTATTDTTWSLDSIKNAALDAMEKPYGVFTDFYKKALDDIQPDVADPTTKTKASKAGKSLADTLASAFSERLKANKADMSAASKEYALWEVTDGDTAALEEAVRKKTESLTREIELQTERVKIAQEQYDTMLSKVGGDNENTKEAYATLLDEKKTLAELERDKQDSILAVIKERYESDTKTAEDEYELWSALYEDSATVTEKSNRKIAYIDRKIKASAEILLATEADYKAVKEQYGEASLKTQAAYQTYLEAQTDQQELINELNKAQIEALENEAEYLKKQAAAVSSRQSLMNKLYNDGDLASRADAYASAVEQYGEDSLEARRAATQGTMTAIIGLGTALSGMRFQLGQVTYAQEQYNETVRLYGKYSEEALAAYENMMDSRSTFAGLAEELGGVFDMSDSAKRALMQLGDAIATNWKPIQNGFSKVWTQVEKRFPQTAEKLANFVGLYMRDGATETISATMNAVVAAMNGDWASAVASGLTAVLDVVGTDFGRTLTEAISTALKNAFGGNGLLAQLLGELFANSGSSGGFLSKLLGGAKNGFFSKLWNWGKSLLGFTSKADKAMAAVNAAGTSKTGLLAVLNGTAEGAGAVQTTTKAIVGSGGLAKAVATVGTKAAGILGKVGGGIAKVASMLGPHGLLIGAAVAATVTVGTIVAKNWDKIKESVGSVFEWIKEKASNLWSGVKGLVGGAINVGKNVVGGLWNGIKGVASGLWNGIKGIGRGIINGFKSIFGIHSPSTVFAEIGGYLMQGMSNGITQSADGVDRSLEEVSAGALKVAQNGAEQLLRALNSEDDPVIRPVVDLSDAENSLSWMDDRMTGSYTRRLNVQRSAALAGAVTAKANHQNGADEKEDDPAKKSGDREVVEAIRQMGDRIDGVARAVSGMKVVMNSRKLVGEIKTDMNNALGELAEKGR